MWDGSRDMTPEITEDIIEENRHIGQDLRLVRVEAGLTHSEISETLKIQSSFLDAIERLDLQALPSVGYVLGYVRAYANHLGMDPAEAVARYKVDSEVPANLGMRNTPHFVPKREIRLPRGFFAASSIVMAAALVAFWYGFQIDAQSASTPEQNNLNNPDTGLQEPLPVDPDLMTFKAVAPTWFQIRDREGESLISRILVTGESWETDMDDNVTLSARDSGALELYLGGELMGRLGHKGIPMKDVPMPAVPREFAVSLPDSVTTDESPDEIGTAKNETGTAPAPDEATTPTPQ